MKKKIFRGLLAVEAAACVLVYLLHVPAKDIFPTILAFPFEQIGAGLRALSLSGGFGNVLAIVLYLVVSLLPAGLLFFLRKKQKLHWEDGLLALLSAVLFYILYLMVNPGFIINLLGIAAAPPVGKAILGGMVYSLVIGYLILRVLRLFSAGKLRELERYLFLMLGVLGAIFIFLAFGISVRDLLASISSVQAGNIGNEHLLGTTYVFLAMQYIVNALPYVLSIQVIFAAMRLLDELGKERYSAASVKAAEQLSRFCANALTIMVLTNILFNLLQLLFAKSIMVANHSVQIPVVSILFVLAALLLTRFMMESKQLKDENDQFI